MRKGLCVLGPVHVNAGARLDVVQVDIAVLGDQVHHAVLLGHLGEEVEMGVVVVVVWCWW